MSDTLDQDVQALKEWLGQAWRYLAQPSLTRFQRQEMRNQMKLADAKLRAGLEKIASRDKLILTGNGDADQARAQPHDLSLKVEACIRKATSKGLKGQVRAITPNGSQ